MEKQYFDLIQFFEGYVRNYRRLNLSTVHNRSMFTKREIDYFANLGEMLGFDSFVEDSKFDKVKADQDQWIFLGGNGIAGWTMKIMFI